MTGCDRNSFHIHTEPPVTQQNTSGPGPTPMPLPQICRITSLHPPKLCSEPLLWRQLHDPYAKVVSCEQHGGVMVGAQ